MWEGCEIWKPSLMKRCRMKRSFGDIRQKKRINSQVILSIIDFISETASTAMYFSELDGLISTLVNI
jgi:hypothetical protein